MRAETDREAFNDIVSQFSDADKNHVFMPAPAKQAPTPDAELDAAGLAQGWSEMTDTHQFSGSSANSVWSASRRSG